MNDDKKYTRLDSLLADYAYTSANDWDDYNELKHLAEIGMAILKLLEEDNIIYDHRETFGACIYKQFRSVEELLKWANGVS